MTDLAAALLRDVPTRGRIYTGGNCLDELVLKKDVLAALSAHLDLVLAERDALVVEKAAAYAQGYGDCETEISLTEIGRTNKFLHGQIAKWKAHAEQLAATKWRLEAALREIADRDYRLPTPREIARAALKGGDHE